MQPVGIEAVGTELFGDGESLTVECVSGYAPAAGLVNQSAWSLLCSDAVWSLEIQPSTSQGWLEANETCQPIPCDPPEDPHGTWHGSKSERFLTLACHEGFVADSNLGVFDCPAPGLPPALVPRCVPGETWAAPEGTDSGAMAQAILLALMLLFGSCMAMLMCTKSHSEGGGRMSWLRSRRRPLPQSEMLVEGNDEMTEEVALDDME